MTSYRESAFKIYEHEQILKHHYRRLHGVRPTVKTTHFSQRTHVGAITKKQRRKRERVKWLRHQAMLKNLQQEKQRALGNSHRKKKVKESKWALKMPPVQNTPQPLDSGRQHSSSAPHGQAARSPPHQQTHHNNDFGAVPSTSPRLFGRNPSEMTGNVFAGGKKGGRRRKRRTTKSTKKYAAQLGGRYPPAPNNFAYVMSPRKPGWDGSTALGLGGRDPSLQELLPEVPHEWLENILSPRAVQNI